MTARPLGRGSRTGSALLLLASFVVFSWLLAIPRVLLELNEQRYVGHGLYRLGLASLTSHLVSAIPPALVVGVVLAVVVPLVERRVGWPRVAGLRVAWLALACFLALLWFALPLLRSTVSRHRDPLQPDLVLISVDTLRADRLGCYGNARRVSPNLDRFAGDGVRFAHAVAPASWTLPSMASVLTGLPALEHGAVGLDTAFAPSLVTLPEALADAGYHTVAVVSHVFVGERYGFAQGVDLFDDATQIDHADVSSERLTRRALDHARGAGGKPLFLWVHYFDPHYTYVRHPEYSLAPPDSRARYTWSHLKERVLSLEAEGIEPTPSDPFIVRVGAVYDEEVAHTDHWIGELLRGLRSLDRGRPRVVAVLGDHGELFFENGLFGHGQGVPSELLHVPLIFGGDVPRQLRGKVVDRTVSLAAVPATFAALAGIEGRYFPGPSLLRLASSDRPYGLPVFALGGAEGSMAVLRGGVKLVRSGEGVERLYQVDADGRETAADGRETAADGRETGADGRETAAADPSLESLRLSLSSALDELERAAARTKAPKVELGKEERKRLRVLGYLQ